MKKFFRIILLLVLVGITLQVPASANSIQDSLVPQDTNEKKIGEVQLEYNEYPQYHYELDTYVDTSGDWMPWNWADGAGKQIYIAIMELVNSAWLLNILFANFSLLIVQEAFELDFVSNVVDHIGAAIQNVAGFGTKGFMSDGLWPLLVTFILCIVGAWGAYVGIIKRETSRAWGGLLSTLIIFVFSLGFFSNAATILKGVNDWSSDLQGKILGISASIVTPGASYDKDEGIATIRNQMFDLMVKKPYLLMQYGTTEVNEGRVSELLSINPILDPEGRQDVAKEEVDSKNNAMMSLDGITQRAGFVPLLALANAIIGTFLLIMSGTIILYQLIFLALALFAPVPLLMALVPRWQHTAVNWFSKLIHAQLMKIAIALLLTILFGISAILYRAAESSDIGFLAAMVLQIICFVGIWAKRKDLFDMVSAAASNVQSSTGQALQGYRQRYNQARNLVGRSRNRMMNKPNPSKMQKSGLADRKNIGFLNKEQQAARKNQQQKAVEAVKNAGRKIGLVGRNDADVPDKELTNHNAPHDKEQLLNRAENPNESQQPLKERESIQGQQASPADDKVVPISELQRRRTARGRLAQSNPVDRSTLNETNRDISQRPETSDLDLVDRTETERNINLINQRQHNDNIQERVSDQITERRTVDRNTEREVNQDIVNRNNVSQNTNEKNINETVNRQNISQENNEKHINETVKRQNISQENNERTSRHVTENNNQETITHRRVNENIKTGETVSKEIKRKNDRIVNTNETVENVSIDKGKPITKWEAQQQIDRRKKEQNK